MSVRTYCVISHYARADTNFFQGVFEDGIRVLYQGRLQSLLFSHVLSPAHDYVKHINGPLLATLREGRNATLILATPNSEGTQPPSSSLSSSTTAGVSHSTPTGEGIAEITSVAMGLYRQLFPLLFRNLEGCPAAKLSVLTVSASERVLLDNLQSDRRIRDVAEAQFLTVHRDTSATAWGTLLQLLEDRHVALEESATSLEGQTAFVVTVDLEGYGRLVVVDTASSQEILQQLTLILGMESDGAARTYPPHTPLRDLLSTNVPPQATVQVVCSPAPQDTVRQTMRVLHFGFNIEAWRGKQGTHGGSPIGPSASVITTTASASRGSRANEGSGGNLKRFSSPPGVSQSLSFNVDHQSLSMADAEKFDIAKEGAQRVGDTSKRELELSNSQTRSPTVLHSSREVDTTPSQLPPPSVMLADHGRQQTQETQARRRIAALEVQVRELEASNEALQRSRDAAVRERDRVELELRSKSSLWADLQRAHTKAKQENADYAQLVQKLLQQVRILEKDTSRQKRQDMSVVKELRQVREEKKELEEQLTRLRKEVMLFRRDATYRAREATLSRIVPSEISVPPQGTTRAASSSSLSSLAARGVLHRKLPEQQHASALPSSSSAALSGKGRGRGSVRAFSVQRRGISARGTSPRARRLYDTFTDDDNNETKLNTNAAEEVEAGAAEEHATQPSAAASPPAPPSAGSQRITDITLEELRWRNRHLEQEVSRLQERLLGALTTASSPARGSGASPSVACAICDTMRERAEFYRTELTHVRDEKDRLLKLLGSSRADQQVCDGDEGAVEDRGVRKSNQLDRPANGASSASKLLPFPPPSLLSSREDTATRGVAAALLAGCASLQIQLECAQAALDQRLHRTTSSPADASTRQTDPLSHISTQVLVQHREAVAALAESLRRVAEKPATCSSFLVSTSSSPSRTRGDDAIRYSPDLLPPIPRTATAGNVETLAGHLTFEAERCRHLRAFIPTFAQLAVATEHLLMRLEATEPNN